MDALERCEARGGDAEHVDVVKSVALIDLFKERSGLAASVDVLTTCLPSISPKRLAEVLEQLADWSVLIHKKHLGAFAIYAGSDFDIEAAVLEARAKMTGLDFGRLKSVAALQPILAKRFYHKTGALLWFDVDIGPLANGVETMRGYRPTNGSAGVFMLLIGTEAESDQKGPQGCARAPHRLALFPLPAGWSRDNYLIREAAIELLALEAVRAHRSELNGDAVARREFHARIARAAAELDDKLRDAFASAVWFSNVPEVDGRRKVRADSDNGSVTLNLLASRLADASYHRMPIVHNELLNRIKPSSNAIAAQKALLRAMVEHHAERQARPIRMACRGRSLCGLDRTLGLARRRIPNATAPFASSRRIQARGTDERAMGGGARAVRDRGPAQVSVADVFDRWRRSAVSESAMDCSLCSASLSSCRKWAICRSISTESTKCG